MSKSPTAVEGEMSLQATSREDTREVLVNDEEWEQFRLFRKWHKTGQEYPAKETAMPQHQTRQTYHEPYGPSYPRTGHGECYQADRASAARESMQYSPRREAYGGRHQEYEPQYYPEYTTPGIPLELFGSTAFADHIVLAPPPADFKIPTFKEYAGDEDPRDHLSRYQYLMLASKADEATMCKCFPNTLSGPALTWMISLPAKSIGGFQQLADSFMAHFGCSQRRRLSMQEVLNVRQKDGESLASFVKRFTTEAVQAHDFDEKVARMAFIQGLKNGPFKLSVCKKPPGSYTKLLEKANQHIMAEELARGSTVATNPSANSGRRNEPARRETGAWEPRRHQAGERGKAPEKPLIAVEMNHREQTPSHAHRHPTLQTTMPPPSARPGKKFCVYHQSTAHDERECQRHGPPRTKIPSHTGPVPQRQAPRRSTPYPPLEQSFPRPDGQVGTISGGHVPKGPSKREMRRITNAPSPIGKPVMSISNPPREQQKMTFSSEDLADSCIPSTDPLVLHVQMGTKIIKRVMVDTGSSADIL